MDLEEDQLFLIDKVPKEGNSHLLGVELAWSNDFSAQGLRASSDLEGELYSVEAEGRDWDDDWKSQEVLIANWILGEEILSS